MGQPDSFVYLTSVVGSFQGNLVVARLRAEGIAAVIRGPGDGPYPFPSEIDVLVTADDHALAQEVLLADAVESTFEELDEPNRRRSATVLGRRRLRKKAGS